jgi:sialate O-acetylesterase
VRQPPLRLFLLVFLLLAPLIGRAQIRLPHLFSDHMVLQRDAPMHIWGWAAPGEEVTVAFHNQRAKAISNPIGQWNLYLAPEPAGGPYQLTVSSTNTITVSDILVGDVWLASGQSNMEMPLKGIPTGTVKDGPATIRSATQRQIRLLRLETKASPYPLDDISASWTTCTPQTAADFSAIAYFFGRNIQSHENVPVGLIDSTWGGTFIEGWLSFDSLSSDASLLPVFASYSRMMDTQADVSLAVALEKRADEAARRENKPLPVHPWHPGPDSFTPALLYNGMIAPLTPYPIKGVIWYQGESNSLLPQAGMYGKLFSALITDWRSKWRQGNFPFLFVQISTFDSTPGVDLKTKDFDWGTLRDAQRRALALANTAMVVSLDVGDPQNIHPPDKETVGSRLALAARTIAYGDSAEYSGPLFRQAVPQGAEMCVSFDHASGLGSHGDSLTGFEVAGEDRQFFPAVARVSGDRVFASSVKVASPVYIRYAWANAPDANLYNSAGLPAGTFTSEDQPLVGNVSH